MALTTGLTGVAAVDLCNCVIVVDRLMLGLRDTPVSCQTFLLFPDHCTFGI